MSQVTTCDRRGVTDTRMWHFFCHIFSCTCYTFRCHISKSPYIIYYNIFEYLAEYACGVLDGVVSIFKSCRKWPDIAFEWIAVLCYAICDGFCCLGLRIWYFQILAIVTGFLAEGAACFEPGGSIPLNRPIQLAICSPRLEPPKLSPGIKYFVWDQIFWRAGEEEVGVSGCGSINCLFAAATAYNATIYIAAVGATFLTTEKNSML